MWLASRCRRAAGRGDPWQTSPSSYLHRRYTTELLESVTRQSIRRADPSLFLRCFPLCADDVVESPNTPRAFHRLLCQKVRDASKRVQLASLYVGAAAAAKSSGSTTAANEEQELLDAIAKASAAGVPVQILLDANRALRPVPVPSSACPSGTSTALVNATTTTATTSAQACRNALQMIPERSTSRRHDDRMSGVFLLSVLHPVLQRVLPNPLNEIAGVFHIKVYVVDDDVILSGANLSHEYFSTRIDRYLHLRQPDLVEFYSQLVSALCEHGAVRYDPTRDDQRSDDWVASVERRRQLQAALRELFTTREPPTLSSHQDDAVAYAVPTFQAPTRYFSRSSPHRFMNHEQTLQNLLRAVHKTRGTADNEVRGGITARIATAYMNPTKAFLRALAAWCDRTVFLTAGMASHGFAPKSQQMATARREDHSKGWTIPNVFRYASRRAVRYIHYYQRRRQRRRKHSHRAALSESPSAAQTAYYQRPGWTFHAKGLWLSTEDSPRDGPTPTTKTSNAIKFSPRERLVAVCTGSGNYGARSAFRDMESNLILIFPSRPSSKATDGSVEAGNSLDRQHVNEWNRLCEFASDTEAPGVPDPPRWIRFAYPWVRPFF